MHARTHCKHPHPPTHPRPTSSLAHPPARLRHRHSHSHAPTCTHARVQERTDAHPHTGPSTDPRRVRAAADVKETPSTTTTTLAHSLLPASRSLSRSCRPVVASVPTFPHPVPHSHLCTSDPTHLIAREQQIADAHLAGIGGVIAGAVAPDSRCSVFPLSPVLLHVFCLNAYVLEIQLPLQRCDAAAGQVIRTGKLRAGTCQASNTQRGATAEGRTGGTASRRCSAQPHDSLAGAHARTDRVAGGKHSLHLPCFCSSPRRSGSIVWSAWQRHEHVHTEQTRSAGQAYPC